MRFYIDILRFKYNQFQQVDMALKSPDRYQLTALPPTIEDYVTPEDPVRAYDAMIDIMDFEALGIPREWKKVGNSPYDPTSMLKLLVYGSLSANDSWLIAIFCYCG